MPDSILMDQINLRLEVSGELDEATRRKIRRTLKSKRFKRQFRETIEEFLRQFPTLAPVRLTVR